MISAGRPDSVGGGVVAEIFRDPHKPTRFSGGGGSRRNFSALQSGTIIFLPGNSMSRSLKSPSFGNIIFTFPPDFDLFRNSLQKKKIYWIFSEVHCRKNTFTKSLGGPWPPWPPLATPLVVRQ